MSRQILSICYDGGLRGTRERALEQDGYIVVTAQDITEAKAQSSNGNFALVIIDDSVPEPDVREIVENLGRLSNGAMVAVLRNVSVGNDWYSCSRSS